MSLLRRLRLLVGISIFWLALSLLTDGVNTLVLPLRLSLQVGKNNQATVLGLLTFAGLLAGAGIQPFAGALSDRLRRVLTRKAFVGIGVLLSIGSLVLFASLRSMPGLILTYLCIQMSASFAQAGQQGLIPDLVRPQQRGLASGFKGFMDIGGAMIGFAVLGQLLGSGSLMLAITAICGTLIIIYALASILTPEDHAEPSRPQAPNERGQASTSPGTSFITGYRKNRAFVLLVLARFLFLLGIYATGRFLLYFVEDRLGLPPQQAAAKAGGILAGLALVTVVASPIGGWLADRLGRRPLMVAGGVLGAISSILLILARSSAQIMLFGGLMSLASAAFSGGSWALLADLAPRNESARYFGLANFSTAGAAAMAGLFGPLMDISERAWSGSGYAILFAFAALAFLASVLPLSTTTIQEVQHVPIENGDRNNEQASAHGGRLALDAVQAHSALFEEDQDPQAGRTPPRSQRHTST